MAQLWGGRFTKETDQMVYDFNASIEFDQTFYQQDIQGSIAHVKMLTKQKILSDEEGKQIEIKPEVKISKDSKALKYFEK